MGQLVLSLTTALGLLAGVTGELGLRAEGRGAALVPAGQELHGRAGATATPTATATADALQLRLTTTYAPRIATSDVAVAPVPFVDHLLSLGLETHHARPWHVTAGASAFRGQTDPLADPLRATATSPEQYGALRPIDYEWLQSRAGAELSLDARSTLSGGASWFVTRASAPTDRALYPTRRDGGVDGAWSRAMTPRDTVRVGGRLGLAWVLGPEGEEATTLLGATVSWRRRLTPAVEGWGGLGATLVGEGRLFDGAGGTGVIPTAEAGFSRDAAGYAVGLQGSVRLAPALDAFTGEVRAVCDTAWQLTWRTAPRLSVRAGATAGAWLDGDVWVAGLDARAIWSLRERLSLEAGVVGRAQHDRRPAVPSFAESALVVAASWRTGPL
ncbi:MAG TPA: hypothetical protein VLT47_15900 [Anaeromyxobacteraceae bacterium]|nr:hypothetical protein [Anaeromyxobacteraceae bacterium]